MTDDKMNDLLESLSSSTRISLEDDDVSLIHPRYAQYKPKTSFNQEERRRQWLIEQKEKRLDTLIVSRGIEGDLENDITDDEGEAMILGETEKKHKNKRKNADCPYRNWLMLSYWLVDVPEDFTTNWYFTICPEGRRCIVVATKGYTIAFSRKGAFMRKFSSALPGGNHQSYNQYTVLDCVFNYSTKIYYVLDVLDWGIPLIASSAELRFFWLSNKFSETPELEVVSNLNQLKFSMLKHDLVQNLPQCMINHPAFPDNEPKVDGILFFQKESFYTSGKSPLATWLKPFMVRDILKIQIHENYMNEIPTDYVAKRAKMEIDENIEDDQEEDKLVPE